MKLRMKIITLGLLVCLGGVPQALAEWPGLIPRPSCAAPMSLRGYKETSSRPKSTSALPPAADILVAITDFRV